MEGIVSKISTGAAAEQKTRNVPANISVYKYKYTKELLWEFLFKNELDSKMDENSSLFWRCCLVSETDVAIQRAVKVRGGNSLPSVIS